MATFPRRFYQHDSISSRVILYKKKLYSNLYPDENLLWVVIGNRSADLFTWNIFHRSWQMESFHVLWKMEKHLRNGKFFALSFFLSRFVTSSSHDRTWNTFHAFFFFIPRARVFRKIYRQQFRHNKQASRFNWIHIWAALCDFLKRFCVSLCIILIIIICALFTASSFAIFHLSQQQKNSNAVFRIAGSSKAIEYFSV